ncbi:uncharacterized protein NFIA_047250 [Aspergillus fischeri NRRL 181]|uniref:Uncharacterized protein n=1 Tax=Neosartorya fischeri (strain ATCC 1020 / DSM 3700 / CBS 544.65 / FGSC A1164 / JCM 1740 / NRRL 181 / WB 181) TaxID=331117 RepID=A1DKR9_NEOFI|nr:uncharacterized protein NFIA_047250 [Aspergillus fischeri NRRL 181]EAW15390.1 hypothetical protein NFIA_047250 [Aspergillus fischeri NRRL 181]
MVAIRRVEARGDATLSRNQRRKRSAQLPVGGHYQWARETIAQSPPFNARQNGIDQRDLPSGAFVDPSPTLPGNGVDLGANFIKAISLTSIIHPTHQHVLPPLPSLDHNSGSNFLKVVDMQSFLLEICLDFGLSLSTFQLLYVYPTGAAPWRNLIKALE